MKLSGSSYVSLSGMVWYVSQVRILSSDRHMETMKGQRGIGDKCFCSGRSQAKGCNCLVP
jgi:hypothetical protein